MTLAGALACLILQILPHHHAWGQDDSLSPRGYFYIDKLGRSGVPGTFDSARDFSEGLAAVRKDGLWGYMDRKGKEVVPPRFEDARPFSEGLAAVRTGSSWGFIGADGAIRIFRGLGLRQKARRGA